MANDLPQVLERDSAASLEELSVRALDSYRPIAIEHELPVACDPRLAPPVIVTRPAVRPWIGASLLVVGMLAIAVGSAAAAVGLSRASVGVSEPEAVVATMEPKHEPIVEPTLDVAPTPEPAVAEIVEAPEEVTPAPSVRTEPRPRVVREPRVRPRVPETPARDIVRDALLAVHSEVEQCRDLTLYGSTVTARIVFRGDTGRVAHAQVNDTHVPAEVRSCIARAARTAELPPFGQDTFVVRYPFRI